MKKLVVAALLTILVTACTKKEENTINSGTSTTDSTIVIDQTTVTEDSSRVISTDSITAKNFRYQSDDARTNFSVTYSADGSTAEVKNETTGETYSMKSAVSASGAKYENESGYYFWEHQGEFSFGRGENDLISGKVLR